MKEKTKIECNVTAIFYIKVLLPLQLGKSSYSAKEFFVERGSVECRGFISVYVSVSTQLSSTGSSGIPGGSCGMAHTDAFLGGGRLGGMSKYRGLSGIGVVGTLAQPAGTVEPFLGGGRLGVVSKQ